MKPSFKLFLILFVIAVLVNSIFINIRMAALTESLVALERRTASLQHQIESGRTGVKEAFQE